MRVWSLLVTSPHSRQATTETWSVLPPDRLRLREVCEGGSMNQDKYSSVLWLQGRNRRLTDAVREMLDYLYDDNAIAAAAVGEQIILGDDNE